MTEFWFVWREGGEAIDVLVNRSCSSTWPSSSGVAKPPAEPAAKAWERALQEQSDEIACAVRAERAG